MCEIIYHKEGAEMPSTKLIEKCWNYNPDGGGILYKTDEGNTAQFMKGYLDLKEYINTYKKLIHKGTLDKSREFALHLRFGTSGYNEKSCTHPFMISEKKEDYERLSGTFDKLLMHNGVIGRYNTSDNYYSDTQLFIMKDLVGKDINEVLKNESMIYNRFLLFDGGTIKLYGAWNYSENSGLYFSNPKLDTVKVICQ